jgi:cytoskeletal protein CcmA (bactofilin family)
MVFNRKPDPRPANLDSLQIKTMDQSTGTPTPSQLRVNGSAASGQDADESVIGNDLTIEGQAITIRCQGSLRVNGNIQADLHSMKLTVGEEAVISGAIAAETIEVYGKVQGAILGSRVRLHASAVVEGDIHSQALSIDQGASFDGRSRKVKDPAEIAPQLTSPGSAARAAS